MHRVMLKAPTEVGQIITRYSCVDCLFSARFLASTALRDESLDI